MQIHSILFEAQVTPLFLQMKPFRYFRQNPLTKTLNMKNLFALLCICTLFFVASCGDDTVEPEDEPETATLKLIVSYSTGQRAPNVNASLYVSQDDYNNLTNAVETGTTGNSGEVYFEEIEAREYWWYVEDPNNNSDNRSSTHWSGGPIPANQTTEKMVQLRQQ